MNMLIGRAGSVLAILALAWSALFVQPTESQSKSYRQGVSWGKLPEGRTWGHVVGIGVDSHDDVWVFDRCGTVTSSCLGSTVAPILEFDSHGNFLRSFGAGMFVLPHGLYIDRDDNIWVTDVAAKGGKGCQVFKLNPEGKILLTLGKAGIAENGIDTFSAPVGVVVAKNGDIFVADGHGGEFDGSSVNARIVKFSKDGRFIKAWGTKGSGPGEFAALHAIAMDSKGRLYVADRGNSRIEIFDQEGNYLTEWRQFGRPVGMFIDKTDTIYVVDSDSGLPPWHDPRVTNRAESRDLHAIINPGFTQGIRIASTKDGVVKDFIPPIPLGPEAGHWNLPESITVDSQGNIYVAESRTMNVRKYSKIE